MRRCRATRLGFGLGLGLLLLLLAVPASAATSTAAQEDGFGSLAVDWPMPVAVIAEAHGQRVEIQASHPFPDDVLARAAGLHPLVQGARLNETATILELDTRAGIVIETAILDDRSLRVALVPRDAATLGLRLGRHAEFERVVLEPVPEHAVRQHQAGARLTLTLPGTLGPADRARLEGVGGIERLRAAGHQLFVDLAPGASVRPLFAGPDRQVLDIYPGTDRPRSPPSDRLTASTTTVTSPGVQPPQPKPGAPSAIDQPSTLGAETTRATDQLALPSNLAEVPVPWTAPAPAPLAIDAERLGDDAIELRFTWPEPVPAAVFVRGAQLWVAFAADSAGIELAPETFTPAARRFIDSVREENHPEATLIRLGLTDAPEIVVDRTDGTWRIALNASDLRARDLDASDRSPATAALQAQPAVPGLLLASLDAMVSLTDPIVGDRIGIGMALEPIGAVADPARFIGLRLLPAAQGAVWQQLVEPARRPVWTSTGLYFGPHDGVVRMVENGPALPAPLLDALPLALDQLDDAAGTGTDTADNGPGEPNARPEQAIELASTAAEPGPEPPAAIGETGSVSPAGEAPAAATGAEPGRPGPLDLARFRTGPGRGFLEQRSALLEAAEAAGRTAPLELALELARLHIARGLGPEAAAILATAPAPSPLQAPSTAAAALNGAAAFLAGRYAAALDHLAMAELEADDETALWRGATLAALERWDEALPHWQRGEPWLEGYPAASQASLTEHGALLLLQTGRIDEAVALLDRLAGLPLAAAAAERLRALEAMALERDGAVDEARTIWRHLLQQGSPEARSRAVMSLTFSDLENGRIDTDDAIAQLVADSVHWRGQRDEVGSRRRLAALQHSAGRIEAALASLQDALAGQPPAEIAALIAGDMAEIVDGLFADLAAGQRSATETLLLYRRYAELVPPGPDGDGKVASLADALGELGLDAAVIDILRSRLAQSNERDAGRAALGYALARHLARTGDGRAAMAALVDSTPIAAIDEPLAAARRELFARIGTSGGSAGATSMVGEAEAPRAALRDRARQAFDSEDWAAVLATTASIEADLPEMGRLDPEASEIVLMAATAARQLGDDPASERLRVRYEDRLATAADNAVLGLLAGAARFSGEAAEVLGEAASHTRAMRRAIADMPSL